jgi:nucleoid DNA-binding protein
MNKESLVKEIAEQVSITKADASRSIDAILNAIQDSLKNCEPVNFIGFGSFKLFKRKARTGRTPRTGEPISIAETIVPVFSTGKSLKQAINE